jgi:hypothetical protein
MTHGPRGFLVKRLAALASAALALFLSAAAPPPIAPWATAALDYSGVFVRYGNLWFDPVPDDPDGKPIQAIRVRGPDRDNIYAGNSDNPILQPWAREIVKANADSELKLEHVYTADDTCWPSGVPQAVNLLDGVQFLQAKDHIVILYQRNHQIRWIWMKQPHSANVKPSWYGESIGHFEGTTLVVDTIGIKAHKMSVVDPFGTPHTDQIHVVERYEPFRFPFGSGTGLWVTVRVEDPGAFTTAWKGTAEYRTLSQPDNDEMICAENNRSFKEGSTFGTIPVEEKPQF